MFSSYLTTPATLIAVIVPFLLSITFLLRARKSGSLPRWYVAAACAALLPVSYAFSYWTFSGYHVQNTFLISLILWCARKEITPGVAYALSFFHTLAIDSAGSLVYALKHMPHLDNWYVGIGGGGPTDLLLILPAVAFIVVRALTAYDNSRTRHGVVACLA